MVCGPAAGQQRSDASAEAAVAAGLGLDAGLIGLKYVRRLAPVLPLEGSAGVGAVGVALGLVWRLAEKGDWSAYGSAGGLYSPWENPLTGEGSAMAVAGLGVQRWPTGAAGLYFNAGIEPYLPISGTFEGGDQAGIAARLQVGWAF